MPALKIVTIGASAGGIEATCSLLSALPEEFTIPIFVVQHIPRTPSGLPLVLGRCGRRHALHPQNGEPIQPNRIYVAPPNQHLLVKPGVVELSSGPRENRFRPAVDPLFRSAARAYGAGVAGVVLSGELDDGTGGLYAIKARGGLAVVQDPDEATSPSMPQNALDHVEVDHCMPVAQIADLLVKCASSRPAGKPPRAKRRSNARSLPVPDFATKNGTPVPVTCPDCGGPLFEKLEGSHAEFKCLVGHAYSPATLTEAHSDALERAIWVAIRTLMERLTLRQALVQRHRDKSSSELRKRFEEEIEGMTADVQLLKQVLERIQSWS